METSKVAAVILAAGTSSRFRAAAGENGPATKLTSDLNGKPLVRRVAEAALRSHARPVIVVTGYADAAVRDALEGLPLNFVYNDAFETGMASSIKRGMAKVPAEATGALILLGDMPLVSSDVLDHLIATFEADMNVKAVVPVYAGQRGNPALIARALFPAVEKLSGDVGARALLTAAGSDVHEAEVTTSAVIFDVDMPSVLDP